MRPLYAIAEDIRRDWKKPYFGAIPYIEAMMSLDKITDRYGYDDGYGVVMYFLSNATSWRGAMARSIKAELKELAKEA